MATKPIETYKWGENATHEQVAAYEDTGWPSDAIPPKRTQFNWYQNLVGRWLGWAEEAVDELVDRVLDAWLVEIPDNTALWPNKSGIYYAEEFYLVFMVKDMFAVHIQPLGPYGGVLIGRRRWTGSEWGAPQSFTRSNSRSDILQESEANYVTPKGLVDYFRVDRSFDTQDSYKNVPHEDGVYGSIDKSGVYIVVGDLMFLLHFLTESISAFAWDSDNNEWTG